MNMKSRDKFTLLKKGITNNEKIHLKIDSLLSQTTVKYKTSK